MLSRTLCVLMLVCASGTAHAITLYPADDAHVSTLLPALCAGDTGSLSVRSDVLDARRAYVRFDLAVLPPGATVARATLRVWASEVGRAGAIDVRPILGAWTEGALTAHHAPAVASWSTGTIAVSGSSRGRFLLLDVSGVVQDWIDGAVENRGLALLPLQGVRVELGSKEGTATGHAPELEVVLEDQGPPGEDGRAGRDGRDGIDGVDGVDGVDGRDGRDGLDGIDGARGADGRDGVDGLDGLDGLACWDLDEDHACNLVYEDIDLDARCGVGDCRGIDGRDGIDGAVGTPGPKGLAGPEGPEGPMGPPGPAGERGPEGRPGTGGMAWSVVTDDGELVAGPASGIVARAEGLLVVRLPPSDALQIGDAVRIIGRGSGGWVVQPQVGQAIAPSPPPRPVPEFTTVASSSDGMHLLATMASGVVVGSSDGGSTWIPRRVEGTRAATMSGNGEIQFVANHFINDKSGLWRSVDFGETWTKVFGDVAPIDAATSNDGLVTVLSTNVGEFGLYVSWTHGQDWAPILGGPCDGSCAVAISGDGSTLAVDYNVTVIMRGSGDFWQILEYNLSRGPAIALTYEGGLVARPGDQIEDVVTIFGGNAYGYGYPGFGGNAYGYGYPGVGYGSHDYRDIPAALAFSADGSQLIAAMVFTPTVRSVFDGFAVLGDNVSLRELAASGDLRYLLGTTPDGVLMRSTDSAYQWHALDPLNSVDIGPLGWRGDAEAAIELVYIGDGIFRTASHEGTLAGY